MSSPETRSVTESPAPEVVQDQAQRAKALVTQIFDSRHDHGELPTVEAPLQEELEAMPREALILAAWQGIANYHREHTVWGDVPRVQRLEQEKEYRKSLLTPDELRQAISQANDWLDDNFSQ